MMYMKQTLRSKIHLWIVNAISILVIIFIFPATFGAFILHEKFKAEAYIDNKASKVEKAIINQKLWVAIGLVADITKLLMIF